MNVKELLKVGLQLADEHLPTICMVGSMACAGAAVILMHGSTLEAEKILKEEESKKKEPLEFKEKLVSAGPCYIKPAIALAASFGFAIASNKVSLSRIAGVATAYKISSEELVKLRKKIVEKDGEKHYQEIRADVDHDRVKDTIPGSAEQPIFITGNGNTKCYDAYSGRYFDSDIEKIRQAVNRFNHKLILEGWLCLNDFYEELGLDRIGAGDDIGWNAENSYNLVEIEYSSQLTKDGIPCLVMNFATVPVYRFQSLY